MRQLLKQPQVLSIVVIILSSIIGIIPLLQPGLWTAHDIWHQVARLFHYSQAVMDGQFLPTWISNMANGYGYPLFIFSYHFPWMTAIPLLLLGVGVFPTLKILFGGAFIASGVTFYLLAYHYTKKHIPAVVGALLYLFAPYHFLSIYVSASIGTVFLFALFPLLFYGVSSIFSKQFARGIVITSASAAAIVLTHFMSVVIYLPFILIFIVLLGFKEIRSKKALQQSILALLASGILTVALTAFYLVPLLVYLPNTQAAQANNGLSDLYQTNLVTLRQLVYSAWGFGPIQFSALDGEISFQVGIAQWLGLAAAIGTALSCLFGLLFSKKKSALLQIVFKHLLVGSNRDTSLVTLGLGALTVLIIAAMTTTAAPYWKFFTQTIAIIDYPFRLLLLAVLFSSLLTAWFIAQLQTKHLQVVVAVLFCAIAYYTNRNHIRVNLYTSFDLDLYVRSELTTNTFHEYAPLGTQSIINIEPESLLNPPLEHIVLERSTTVTKVSITSPIEQLLMINVFDFPGQTVYVDDQRVQHTTAENKIQVMIPTGSSTVMVRYEKTPVMQVMGVISLAALIILGSVVPVARRWQRKQK